MLRRLIALLAALALLVPGTALGQDPTNPDRFTPSPVRGVVDPQVLPIGLDDARTVTVILQLEGDPVAVVESKDPDKQLSATQEAAVRSELVAAQDALSDDIAAAGGTILTQVQSAYNGIGVRIARNDAQTLAGLPGVTAVRAVGLVELDNETSVPYIGTPDVWESYGFTGGTIKIGIIDTGIDYTHANFAGPGSAEAYELADANDTTIADAGDAGLFGADAPKIKGGYDFVGDDYDFSSADPAVATPQPDPDPLDCNGHGSHVAGTAAGLGVTAEFETYAGPYDATTHETDFEIGPGVAPRADLYALRVFGCAGSASDLDVINAIEWAVDNDLDVINMSLGSPFGLGDDPTVVASDNASAAGTMVVASAGNEGGAPYITGSPGTATSAISVAALDAIESTPGVLMTFEDGSSILAQNSNEGHLPVDPLEVFVVYDASGAVSEGCDPADYAGAEGKLAVVIRGTCARVAKAIYGQEAGAAAVAMINTDPGYPPFEGPITSNPDTGENIIVTIPFLGIRGVLGPDETADPDLLVAQDGNAATLTDASIANPGFGDLASFSSGGPRSGDSWLKPDITAPGVSIQSTLVASGDLGGRISGTSMASPHVAGVAALTMQAHPDWSVEDLKAAIVNTGDPAGVGGHQPRLAGTGLVQPLASTTTRTVAVGDAWTGSLNYGYAELSKDFSMRKTLTIRNHGDAPVTYNLASVAAAESAPASVSLSSSSVTVPAGGEARVRVTLSVPAASVPNSDPALVDDTYHEVAGFVELTSDAAASLRVPYYLVPRSLSDIKTTVSPPLSSDGGTSTATVTNARGMIAGVADTYAYGLRDDSDAVFQPGYQYGGFDLRAVGVQSFDAAALDPEDPELVGQQLIVFAVNNHDRWSSASTNEYDILLDTDGDGVPNSIVIGIDLGLVLAGEFSGEMGSFVLDLATGELSIFFLGVAPTDSSTILLPVLSSQIGVSAENPSFTYRAESYNVLSEGFDFIDDIGGYNAYQPPISQGEFLVVGPGETATFDVAVDPETFDPTLTHGVMVVSLDDRSGPYEAELIDVSRSPGD